MKKIAFLIFSLISLNSCSQSLMKINRSYKNISIKEKDVYIDEVKVFEANFERVLYEIFNDRYLIITVFDKVNTELALSLEYLGKNEIYIIDTKQNKNVYKAKLGGITGNQILRINLEKESITIKDFEDKKQEVKLLPQ